MGQVYGYNTWLGWAEETTYGTAVAAARYAEIEKESMKDDGSKFNFKPILRFRSQNRKILGKANPSGAITLPALWTGLEQLWKHSLGSVAVTGPVSSVYTHTYSLAAQPPVGLTTYIDRDSAALSGSTAFRHTGCRVNKLTIRQAVEEWMMLDLELIGAARSQVARPTPTFPTFDPVDYAMMTVKAINPAGTNIDLPLRSLEITIDNGLHQDGYRLGSRFRQLAGAGDSQRKVNFKFEAEFNNNAVYAYFLNNTDTGLDLVFTWKKDPLAAVSSTNPQIQMTLPKVVFDGEDPAIDSPGPKYLSISGTSLLPSDTNDNAEFSIVLQNATVGPD